MFCTNTLSNRQFTIAQTIGRLNQFTNNEPIETIEQLDGTWFNQNLCEALGKVWEGGRFKCLLLEAVSRTEGIRRDLTNRPESATCPVPTSAQSKSRTMMTISSPRPSWHAPRPGSHLSSQPKPMQRPPRSGE